MDRPLSEATVERLERLANLRDSGVLTDAEFEQQKRMLLITPAPPLPTTAPVQSGLIRRLPFSIILVSTVIIAGVGLLWLLRPGAATTPPEGDHSQPKNLQVAAQTVPLPKVTRPTPSGVSQSIPSEYRGRWAENPEFCSNGIYYRIQAGRLDLEASDSENFVVIPPVARANSNSIRVHLGFAGLDDGGPAANDRHYETWSLNARRDRLTRAYDGGSDALVKCLGN